MAAKRLRHLCLCIASVAAAGLAVGCGQAPAKPSFRDSDATLIEVCFDSIGRDAPQRLRADEITDLSLTTATLELIGFTTADRPVYQARLAHPTQFRALFLQLPESTAIARIDRPADLVKSIDGWRSAPQPAVCTTNKRAAMYVLSGRSLPDPVACPELEMSVRFSVGSGSAFTARRNLDRQRPPLLFNGLRGCNQFIHGTRSDRHGGS